MRKLVIYFMIYRIIENNGGSLFLIFFFFNFVILIIGFFLRLVEDLDFIDISFFVS